MKAIRFLALMASTSLMVSACAPQTAAPVVNGMFGKQQTVASSTVVSKPVHSTQPKAVARVEAPAIQEEKLALISPAAGPSVKPVAKVAVAEPEPTYVEHKVTATDTIYKLARQYNVGADRILKDNNLAATSDIREGMTLQIASNSKPQSTAWDDMKRMLSTTPTETAAVAPTSQVANVATTAKTPAVVAAQATANVKELAAIEPAAGERPKADDAVGFENYTVQPKETIYRISLKYNVSVLDIMAANDFEQPQDLKANAVIKVPVKRSISAQLAEKAAIAPAAGIEEKAPVVVETAGQPVQVAMLSKAPAGAEEAKNEDLDSKAVQQQAFKDAMMPVKADKSSIDVKKAELKRGQIDRVAAAANGLVWPVKGQILKRFGDDGNGVARTGINIAVPQGTSVLASEGGTVLYADDGLKIYGKMVLIRHDDGMVSAYAHNGYLLVKKNERVKKGQIIALSGASGNVESPQLHFELRQHASAIDPMRMLPRLSSL